MEVARAPMILMRCRGVTEVLFFVPLSDVGPLAAGLVIVRAEAG
ncbi:hypothetical protein AK812_SmicGene48268, partial [Symbiodinium microadriaticum]